MKNASNGTSPPVGYGGYLDDVVANATELRDALAALNACVVRLDAALVRHLVLADLHNLKD